MHWRPQVVTVQQIGKIPFTGLECYLRILLDLGLVESRSQYVLQVVYLIVIWILSHIQEQAVNGY